MSVRLEHVALWVRDLEAVAGFYAEYFDAQVGPLYRNPKKGFESRFLSFASGARLEIMTRTDVASRPAGESLGYAHIAMVVGDEAAVDAMATRLKGDGVAILDGPRRTGDGYYECVALDPEGNRVEIAAA